MPRAADSGSKDAGKQKRWPALVQMRPSAGFDWRWSRQGIPLGSGGMSAAGEMSWSSDWAAPFLWIILSPLATVLLSVFMYTALAHPVPPEEIGLPPNETGPIEFFGPVVKTDTEPACHTFAVTCYEYAPVIPTLLAFVLPGLLNLVPFAWLLRRGAAVRAAAAVAGLLGLLRLAIPVAVLLLGYERVSVPEGGTYFRFIVDGWFEVFGEPYDAIWAAGALAWFGSLLAWGVFALVVFAPGLKSSERTAAR